MYSSIFKPETRPPEPTAKPVLTTPSVPRQDRPYVHTHEEVTTFLNALDRVLATKSPLTPEVIHLTRLFELQDAANCEFRRFAKERTPVSEVGQFIGKLKVNYGKILNDYTTTLEAMEGSEEKLVKRHKGQPNEQLVQWYMKDVITQILIENQNNLKNTPKSESVIDALEAAIKYDRQIRESFDASWSANIIDLFSVAIDMFSARKEQELMSTIISSEIQSECQRFLKLIPQDYKSEPLIKLRTLIDSAIETRNRISEFYGILGKREFLSNPNERLRRAEDKLLAARIGAPEGGRIRFVQEKELLKKAMSPIGKIRRFFGLN